jgi:hypothetical protein
MAGWRKMQGNWVLEFGWQVPRIEVADDICLRRPTPPRVVEPMMMMMICDHLIN